MLKVVTRLGEMPEVTAGRRNVNTLSMSVRFGALGEIGAPRESNSFPPCDQK